MDGVQVPLEDLVFAFQPRVAAGQFVRQNSFLDLASVTDGKSFFGGHHYVADQLLSDGTCSLYGQPPKVVDEGSQYTSEIYSDRVLVEGLLFHGYGGVAQVERDLLKGNHGAESPFGVEDLIEDMLARTIIDAGSLKSLGSAETNLFGRREITGVVVVYPSGGYQHRAQCEGNQKKVRRQNGSHEMQKEVALLMARPSLATYQFNSHRLFSDGPEFLFGIDGNSHLLLQLQFLSSGQEGRSRGCDSFLGSQCLLGGKSETGAGGDEFANDDALLETMEIVAFPLDSSASQHADSVLERGR